MRPSLPSAALCRHDIKIPDGELPAPPDAADSEYGLALKDALIQGGLVVQDCRLFDKECRGVHCLVPTGILLSVNDESKFNWRSLGVKDECVMSWAEVPSSSMYLFRVRSPVVALSSEPQRTPACRARMSGSQSDPPRAHHSRVVCCVA